MAKNPHAQALGKLGGKVKSAKKAAAVRENGKKGGRPKRVVIERITARPLSAADITVAAAGVLPVETVSKKGFWTRYEQEKP